MQLNQLFDRLAQAAGPLDEQAAWPASQLQWLAASDVLRWGLPKEWGGLEISETDQLDRYIDLSAACLTTAFVLTQRNGACTRIADCDNTSLKQQLLPALIAGERFATVGISHLTTSRQHLGRPAVSAETIDSGYVLDGTIPWVTGAAHADHLVAGGTLADGRQLLLAIPTSTPGVTVDPPVRLLALTGSHTASVTLDRVNVPAAYLIAGPVERVMQQGTRGAGSLTTSALALGLARRALGLLQLEADTRPDLQPVAAAFQSEFDSIRGQLLTANSPAAEIRQRSNSLALRLSQAVLAVSKGAGYVVGHPAERAVREAMFFLVWSCPQPVVAAALSELACRDW